MGCGQSKINLYPRRNKGGSKGQNGKKSAGSESKDADEEEAGGAKAVQGDASVPADNSTVPPLTGGAASKAAKPDKPLTPPQGLGHANANAEISASQQDFFKMLDEKIDKGQDYDSSSETEIEMEQARVASLLTQWKSASEYSQTPTPSPTRRRHDQRTSSAKHRQSPIQHSNNQHHPQSIQQPEVKPRSPDVRRCLKGQPASPPPRRCQFQVSQETYTEKQDPGYDPRLGSPKRQAPSPPANFKSSPKIAAQFLPKNQRLPDPASTEEPRCYSPSLLSQREIHQSYGVSQEYLETTRDTSQITYNPTFQSHSPAHVAKNVGSINNPQPYIAQIVTYPMSQQTVAYQNTAQKFIAPQATAAFQQQPVPVVPVRYPGRAQIGTTPQQNIYYIAPTAIVPPQMPVESILTPKQQTALHLQQYVAMKQAQQALGYVQRIPGGQTVHDFGQYSPAPDESPGNYNRKLYDRNDESYSLNFMTVGRQPAKNLNQNPTIRPLTPGLVQMPTSSGPLSPGVAQQYGQLLQRNQGMQNRPGCTASLGRNQSLSQKDMMTAERYGISSPTVQNSLVGRPGNNLCQSLNIVTQKTVGQIVPMGSQDLIIYQNVSDGPLETRSRGSEENALASNAEISAHVKMLQSGENKPGREQFFSTADTQIDQKSVVINKQHLGSNIVGRQMYYSQVVSGSDHRVSGSHFVGGSGIESGGTKKVSSDASSVRTTRAPVQTKTSVENSSSEYL